MPDRDVSNLQDLIFYRCHQCASTLNAKDLDGDGNITVLDIDFIIH
jgi:hypothetical protein